MNSLEKIFKITQSLDILRAIKPTRKSDNWVHFVRIETNLSKLLTSECCSYLGAKKTIELEDKWLNEDISDAMGFGDWLLTNNFITFEELF